MRIGGFTHQECKTFQYHSITTTFQDKALQRGCILLHSPPNLFFLNNYCRAQQGRFLSHLCRITGDNCLWTDHTATYNIKYLSWYGNVSKHCMFYRLQDVLWPQITISERTFIQCFQPLLLHIQPYLRIYFLTFMFPVVNCNYILGPCDPFVFFFFHIYSLCRL